jgi:hypothetical protein
MLKSQLRSTIATLDRGLSTTAAQRKQVDESVAQLEANSPYPRPLTNAGDLLAGNWRLLYTSSTSLLGIDRLPLLGLGEIYQYIDLAAGRIYNVAEVRGAFGLNSVVTVCARISPTSDRRVGVVFDRSIVGLQSLLNYQNASSWLDRVREAVVTGKKFTALDLAINAGDRGAWLEIIYLDADLRIGRGNEGNIFILERVD